MQADINYVINNPEERRASKVIIRYAGTENTIDKSEVAGKISADQIKCLRLLGLTDSQIKCIIKFLRS